MNRPLLLTPWAQLAISRIQRKVVLGYTYFSFIYKAIHYYVMGTIWRIDRQIIITGMVSLSKTLRELFFLNTRAPIVSMEYGNWINTSLIWKIQSNVSYGKCNVFTGDLNLHITPPHSFACYFDTIYYSIIVNWVYWWHRWHPCMCLNESRFVQALPRFLFSSSKSATTYIRLTCAIRHWIGVTAPFYLKGKLKIATNCL